MIQSLDTSVGRDHQDVRHISLYMAVAATSAIWNWKYSKGTEEIARQLPRTKIQKYSSDIQFPRNTSVSIISTTSSPPSSSPFFFVTNPINFPNATLLYDPIDAKKTTQSKVPSAK